MTQSADQSPSLTEALADLLNRPVSDADRARAALHLVDWLGCALAGSRTEIGAKVTRMIGGHPFHFAGSGDLGGIAAMGALGSLLEMDDVHRGGLLHPGPVIMPVFLGLSYAVSLDPVIKGYEAMIRLGQSVGPRHYAFFHNTSSCGSIGAAVASAVALGLSRDEQVSAIGHAMSTTGGFWQARHEPVATKHLHVAEAARRGVIAMQYAVNGLAGPRYILEGPQGFFAAVAQDGVPTNVIAEPDADWKIYEVSFKPWPACRHAHPAIDTALILRDQLAGRTPRAIHVETYSDAVVFCDKPDPRTAADARFSLQHAVAVVLQDGPPSLVAFEPENLNAYTDLRGRVTVGKDADFTTAYPAHFGARITISTDEGPLTAQVDDAWGDTENPMDEAATIAKFHQLSDWAGVSYADSRALCTDALALAQGAPIDPLHETMHKIARQIGVRN